MYPAYYLDGIPARRSGASVGEVGGRHGNRDGELGRREGREAVVVAQLRPRVPRLGPLVEEGAQRLALLLHRHEVAPEEGERLPLSLGQRGDGALVQAAQRAEQWVACGLECGGLGRQQAPRVVHRGVHGHWRTQWVGRVCRGIP